MRSVEEKELSKLIFKSLVMLTLGILAIVGIIMAASAVIIDSVGKLMAM